ncbi:MAG: thymidine phosphorylase [Deltaproteobacteria bacterium]|nr:thymidine phosphorylase [Deltaproteobacteria bacterium]
MRAYDIIKAKRDGQQLEPAQIGWLIDGFTRGEIPDYQLAAFAMAVFFRDLGDRELGALTEAMLRSGRVLDLSDLPGAKVDKHSTGGVGDKISLPLAPAVAACGVKVPMISGRGLGHTGGTLDKLEAIPGFRVDLEEQAFRRIVREVGVCMIGQTASLAPADKKLYALRDVTATVDCIPLIVSSIMSKKLAEGIDALVLDVKVGSGAFMKRLEDARSLARKMVGTGNAMGKRVVAYVTRMDEPLGRLVGNALETRESIETLHGRGPADIVELVEVLGGEMLLLGNVARDHGDGRARIRQAIASGAAAATFKSLIEAQGGDPAVVDDPGRLPQAAQREPHCAENSGVLAAIDCEGIGLAAMELGAGRARASDPVDPAVGLCMLKRIGEPVQSGEPLVDILHNGRGVDACRERLARALQIGEAPGDPRPLIIERLG